MPKTLTVQTYSLAELKEAHPEAYERVHERWKEGQSGDIPWSEETMDSLKAVVKACGGRLTDWSIGAYAQSHCSVSVDDEDGDTGKPKDARWFRREVLKPNGYIRANGHPYFPGNCAFTGYCADDTFLEAAYKALQEGETLTEALEGLADVAREMMEADLEQAESEESMEANWGDNRYLEDGEEAPNGYRSLTQATFTNHEHKKDSP